MIRKLFITLPGLTWAGTASADLALNMPKGVTKLSAETYSIHMLAFWCMVAIGVVVFGAMIYSLFAYRKSRGAKS
ncbi:MAG: cytochrome c oxidase subunit II, partial [Woeseiaceae bacterium]